MLDDSVAWQRLMQGDRICFKQLIENHYTVLYQYGCKFTSDTELVRDCIQELFIGLWESRSRLSINVNPKAYLIASLRRLIHRKLQKESRMLTQGMITSDFFDVELSAEHKMVEEESASLLLRSITQTISTLPKRQKEVIYLKFFRNLTRDEIAIALGNSPQTVSNLLQLALKKLRIGMSAFTPSKKD